MKVPGTETRTGEDRSCDVNCACGTKLLALRPGQRVAMTAGAGTRSVSVTCTGCHKTTRIEIAGE